MSEQSSEKKLLETRHLGKEYNGRWVVKDVSFSVESGQIVGLLGPNGAGKTTSFYMLVGLVKMDRGAILLDHHDLSHLTMDQRAKYGIGYLPQEPSIFRKLTIEDNIMSVLQLRKDLNKKEREQELDFILEDFNLEHIRHSLGMSVSGGERRRSEIARALAAKPHFILLDEPFAGVDPISVNEIKRIITKLQKKGLGVLITDHNVRETLTICEKAYIVSEGSVIAEGSPQDIVHNELVREVYLGEDFRV